MGVIEYSKRITENILTAVINYIMNGLKSGAEDYVSSSYIVLACLLPKVLLVSKVLEAIMQAVFKVSVAS